MSVGLDLSRLVRRTAWKAGLIRDRTESVGRHIERVLDTRGRELFETSRVPGLVAIVRFGEGRTITRCLGVASPGVLLRPDTVFPALSITKPVTAMCVMALVGRGLLDLDEPVWRRLTSYRLPAHASGGFDPDGITLRGLLSHGSGIRQHGHGWAEEGEFRGPKELLEDETVPVSTLKVIGPPGVSIRYAGGGFLLAELLIEDVTGQRFADVARDLVLRPLGMASSDYVLTPELAVRLATSHDRENRPLPARRLLATSASGLYSTAEDLTTFWASLATTGPNGEPPGRGVISPGAAREMVTSQIEDTDGNACGLGFYLRPKRFELRYSHLGYYEGWNHQVEGFLRRRAVVTLLSNGDLGRECVLPLARALRKTLYERAY